MLKLKHAINIHQWNGQRVEVFVSVGQLRTLIHRGVNGTLNDSLTLSVKVDDRLCVQRHSTRDVPWEVPAQLYQETGEVVRAACACRQQQESPSGRDNRRVRSVACSWTRRPYGSGKKRAAATQNSMGRPGARLQIFHDWYDFGFEQAGPRPDSNNWYRSAVSYQLTVSYQERPRCSKRRKKNNN